MLEVFVLLLFIRLIKVWLTPPSPPSPSHKTNKQRNLFLNVIPDMCLMYLRGRSSPLNFHDHMSFNVDLQSANIASWLGVRNSFYIILVLFLQSVSHCCLWKFHKLVFLFIPYILDHSNVSYCQLITLLFSIFFSIPLWILLPLALCAVIWKKICLSLFV